MVGQFFGTYLKQDEVALRVEQLKKNKKVFQYFHNILNKVKNKKVSYDYWSRKARASHSIVLKKMKRNFFKEFTYQTLLLKNLITKYLLSWRNKCK